MALPRKRAANRSAAKSGGGDGYGGMGGGGSRMAGHKMHGSPASVGASKGRGPVAGAGELELPHNGPGRAASRYAGMDKTMYPSRKTPPGTPSGHMDVYAEGSGSNKSRT
jgi:hypothetical protein